MIGKPANMANHFRSLLLASKRSPVILGRHWLSTSARACGGAPAHGGEVQPLPIKTEIGKREVVGFGISGEENYVDTINAPFPAIRFKEDNSEILKLREKEKADWKKLTLEEKKQLYRASFCQTFAERHAPTGEWKSIIGWVCFAVSMGIWGVIGLKLYVYDLLPTTITDEEHQKKQIQRMLDMRVGAVGGGLASQYDYDKNEWKK